MVDSVCVSISSHDDVARVVHRAIQMARACGLGETARMEVTTAAAELATNITKYAAYGQVTMSLVERDGRVGLQLVAEDSGPGIPDVELAMQDHYTTGGTLGLGLPGVRRMMDDFEIASSLSEGTRVTVRKWDHVRR